MLTQFNELPPGRYNDSPPTITSSLAPLPHLNILTSPNERGALAGLPPPPLRGGAQLAMAPGQLINMIKNWTGERANGLGRLLRCDQKQTMAQWTRSRLIVSSLGGASERASVCLLLASPTNLCSRRFWAAPFECRARANSSWERTSEPTVRRARTNQRRACLPSSQSLEAHPLASPVARVLSCAAQDSAGGVLFARREKGRMGAPRAECRHR